MHQENLRQLSKWMGFVGIMTIIGGVISAIMGVFALIIGAVPGIIAIIMGVKLRGAKQSADAMLLEASDASEAFTGNLNMFVSNLNTYFKIQGVLIIVALLFGLLGGFAAVLAGMAYMQTGVPF